ncbi:MAG: AAA-like domain-containing protein, partial [Cyanobacteria bacterium J06598_3]
MVITMEFPCGALALDASQYIERPPIESRCYKNLETPGSLTRIKGPRHTGKSSLLVRVLAHAKALGYQSAFVDFQAAEDSVYSDLSRFLRWLCAATARQLKLPPALDDYWDEDIGAKLSATFYFEEYLFEAINAPIVLAFNEVNRVFAHPEIARDFLPLLRFWYEQAKQGNNSFRQLRMLVVHSTDVYVPLNIHQSPFNVGLPITLMPFDLSQSQQLAERYGVTLNPKDHQALRALVGGHPYLLSIAFYYLGQGQLSLSQLLVQSPTPAGIYRHHLQACLDALEGQP